MYLTNLLQFWSYKRGKDINKLEENLADIIGVEKEKVFLFENGRTAEYIFLKSLKLNSESNIAIQGFTCNAVVNPVLWLGLSPLYIDINPYTLNMSVESLYERINDKTRVVIVQHTFGKSFFDTKKKFREFVDDMHTRDIVVFEDCAHSLGVKIEDQSLGTFGDAALFSFGIEKVLSTRVGGALVVNNRGYLDGVMGEYEVVGDMNFCSTFLWLLNPIIWRVLRFLKITEKGAVFLKKLGLLNMGFENKELFGKMPGKYPRRLSNALCRVVNHQLGYLDDLVAHRVAVSSIYFKNLVDLKGLNIVELGNISKTPFLKFPIICETEISRKKVRGILEENGQKISDWYDPIIYPKFTDIKSMRYEVGSCPVAEKISKVVLNLSTGFFVNFKMTEDVSKIIISFFENEERGKI